MILKEFIEVNDSGNIQGFIIFKKDNIVIFEKKNMITAEGREYIREIFIKNALISSFIYTPDYAGYQLTKIGFGSSGTANNLTTSQLSGSLGIFMTLTPTTLDAENGGNSIKFKGTLNNTDELNGVVLREIGLFLTKTDNSDILFSRVVFDPVFVEAGSSYDIEYYLYF